MAQSEFVGVDACRSGWFSVGFSGNGEYELEVFHTFKELLNHFRDAKLILVDMAYWLARRGEKASL